jgi:PAP2 superfamily
LAGSSTSERSASLTLTPPAVVRTPAAAPAAARVAATGLSSPEPQQVKRPRWWGELLVIVWLSWVYDMVTNLAPLRERVALAHGSSILRFEQSLHIAPELSLNRWLAAHHTLALVLSNYYDNAHFVVTLGLLGWLWWRRADIYRPLRNSLVAINLLGLIVFWRYPVAPPRMLASGGFTDVVASTHAFGSWHSGSLATEANQFGAMPSLHIAWAAWCTLALWQLSTRVWVRVLALLYPCLTVFAVLATGNHYLLDVLAGLATFALGVALVRLMSVALVTKLLLSRKTGRLAAASEDAL